MQGYIACKRDRWYAVITRAWIRKPDGSGDDGFPPAQSPQRLKRSLPNWESSRPSEGAV